MPETEQKFYNPHSHPVHIHDEHRRPVTVFPLSERDRWKTQEAKGEMKFEVSGESYKQFANGDKASLRPFREEVKAPVVPAKVAAKLVAPKNAVASVGESAVASSGEHVSVPVGTPGDSVASSGAGLGGSQETGVAANENESKESSDDSEEGDDASGLNRDELQEDDGDDEGDETKEVALVVIEEESEEKVSIGDDLEIDEKPFVPDVPVTLVTTKVPARAPLRDKPKAGGGKRVGGKHGKH